MVRDPGRNLQKMHLTYALFPEIQIVLNFYQNPSVTQHETLDLSVEDGCINCSLLIGFEPLPKFNEDDCN